jgi:hypothetical protein
MRRPIFAALAGGLLTLVVAAPAAAAGAWTIVPSVDPVAGDNQLTAVSARSTNDAWAVGFFVGADRDEGRFMLTERWNGSTWNLVRTPHVVHFDENLLAVAASGADEAWAVGSTNQAGFASTNPLAAHWNGSAWTTVATAATTGSAKSILSGVVDFGPTNAWAVGRSRTGLALIEHWDGAAWSIVVSPAPPVHAGSTLASASLNAIAALTPTDIWAVGSYSVRTGVVSSTFTLTEHYDGTTWTIVSSPNPGTPSTVNGVAQVLNSVAIVNRGDVWAVGQTIDTVSGSFQPDRTMILHWNGTAWAVVASPDHPAEDTLRGVAVTSARDVWAVGTFTDRTSGFPIDRGQIQHWDGAAWTVVASPNAPTGDTLLKGVATVRGSAEAWAVGQNLTAPSTNRTFVLHSAP